MKETFSKIGARLSVLPMLALPSSAYAQLDKAASNLGDVGKGVSQEVQRPLPQLIGSIINVALGVLGIILVVLIVYAGFLYMTAGGSDDQTKKAKKIMINAVIGLVLIIAAYAIATFVINQVSTAVSSAPQS